MGMAAAGILACHRAGLPSPAEKTYRNSQRHENARLPLK